MLTLQKASAGSGKTYALTRHFIHFLIAVKPEGASAYRLRTDDEILDGIRRILAITFTNKATNEMQMRIIDKLDDLANYNGGPDRPDYLDDFMKEFKVPAGKISEIAGNALKMLLNNYSDFNVSTIDSFFQLVLRTLAYECGVMDAYQVELESNYVSRMGLNGALDAVDNPRDPDSREIRIWLQRIMDNEEGTAWNIFQKRESGHPNSSTPYQSLLADFQRIDNEEFRKIRGTLEEYLNDNTDILNLYNELEDKHNKEKRLHYRAMTAEAQAVIDTATDPDQLTATRTDAGKPFGAARKILQLKPLRFKSVTFLDPDKFWGKKSIEANVAKDSRWAARKEHYLKMQEAYGLWQASFETLWESLRVSFPFLGLLKAVSKRRLDYLRENGAVELGETSMILHKFIKDTDTPFVYERLGTMLNHLLIDEFQDTSEMQWVNLSPLVRESLSRGNDNLIIGDAKQSIYRFRNAEPELINTRVERELNGEFGDGAVEIAGHRPSENANWRSDPRIVEWNNSLFSFIIRHLGEIVSPDDPERRAAVARKFGDLYSNVCQTPQRKGQGYVEVRVMGRGENPEDEALTKILDTLKRGYSQKDICILTRTNTDGTAMVERLQRYNRERDPEDPDRPELEFISEQSLLVASSVAVRDVVTILEAINRSTMPRRNDGKEAEHKGPGDIRDLECHILLYRQMHPDKSIDECLKCIQDEVLDVSPIIDMLREMQTTALPALVEAIIANFMAGEFRQLAIDQAAFLAAFQDAVIEYCDGHPADLPSFLAWWERKKRTLAISSPEDLDAIAIMTTHKSKGLEFPVVIITHPLSDKTRLGDFVSGKEWRWVPKSQLKLADKDIDDRFPPYVPVQVTEKLKETSLRDLLYENYDLETMDTLNLLYVALTRAKSELYVYDRMPEKDYADKPVRSLAGFVLDFLECDTCDGGRWRRDEWTPAEHLSWPDSYDSEDGVTVTYGEQPSAETVLARKRHEEEKKLAENSGHPEPEARNVRGYMSAMPPESIKCRVDNLTQYVDSEDYDDDDSRDPRSMGNVCHGIMERVVTLSDLPREIRRAVILGLVPQGASYVDKLSERLHDAPAEVRRWFGGGCRVVTERPLLNHRNDMRRPDRIMIWPDGSADIVDYKFGKRMDRRHDAQVKRYVDYLKDTTHYTAVRGWLYYVFEDDPASQLVRVAD